MPHQFAVAFDQSLSRVTTALARMLPGVMAMALIVALATMVGVVARVLVKRFLDAVRLDAALRRWGLASETPTAGKASRTVARVVFWSVLLLGFLLGLLVFDTPFTNDLSTAALALLPRVLVAAVIFALGLGLARYLERSVLISAVNLQLQSARLLGVGAKWLALLLTAALALEHLGVGGGIVTLFFGILFGGIVLALALAIGLGSREVVSRSLEKRLQPKDENDAPSHVQHM